MKKLTIKIAAITAVTFLSYMLITNFVESGFKAVSNVVKPTVSMEYRIFNALGKIKEESKLVVLTAELMWTRNWYRRKNLCGITIIWVQQRSG